MTNKEEIIHALENGLVRDGETISDEGWVWTSNLGLYPLNRYAPAIRALEKEGRIEAYRDEVAARQGWGTMVRLCK